MGDFAAAERAELGRLLLRRGPEAPTLLPGWTTGDLAAHLVVRERRPLAAVGIALPLLAGHTERTMAAMRSLRTYPALVELLTSGPPRWSPGAWSSGLDSALNLLEFFVHHEDVRRAAEHWEPRTLDPGFEDGLWSALRRTGRVATRRSPVGVVLHRRDGGSATAHQGQPAVTLTGRPSELTLFVLGRTEVARVDITGRDEDVAALRATKLGL